MNAKEAGELKKGQRVMWDNNYLDTGTVCFHNSVRPAVWIRRDDLGVISDWYYYEDMQKVEKASG